MNGIKYATNRDVISVYENDAYNLTIYSDGNAIIARNTDDSNVVISQLMNDLAKSTVRLETLVNAMNNGVTLGILPAEFVNELLEGTKEQIEPSKKR